MFELNEKFPLRDKDASNAMGLGEMPRHRWYLVKEGFSPKMVEEAVSTDGVQPGQLLLDPFSGSGTVPLAGALAGLRAQAFEVNPFLHFLSASKLSRCSANAFRKARRAVLRGAERQIASPLEGYSTFTKGNRWERWLFPTRVLRSFEAGWQVAATSDSQTRRLLQLALLGAAMDCCNATRDGKCLRYHNNWIENEATTSQFRSRLEVRSMEIAADLENAPIYGKASTVKLGDARRLVTASVREKFRLCVTSPPYLNSFDYSDVYRPELFLGGFVDSNDSLMKIRLKTVRSHVQASWEKPINDDFGVLYRDCISTIRDSDVLWSDRLPNMVQAYFEDMEIILRGLRHRALENASLWLVVSTSAYGGIEIPVDLILAEIGQRSGWFLREVGVLRHLRSSSQHFKHVDDAERKSVPLRESVVIFDATTTTQKRKRNRTKQP
jgi:hypothetical protein